MTFRQCQLKILNVARIADYEVHEGAVESQNRVRKRLTKRNVLRCRRKTCRDGDDWMSAGNELQRSDAATGNVRRPTVVSRNGGTNS